MTEMLELIIMALGLGVAYAMDAFSVSLTNGLSEPHAGLGRASGIAGVFAGFQAAMPLIGWFLITTLANAFEVINKFIPFVAFGLLLFIGGKMLIEGIMETVEKAKAGEESGPCETNAEKERSQMGERAVRTTFLGLLVQGVATSIDALSGGFGFVGYQWWQALVASLLIAAVTFVICFAGVLIGRKCGTKLAEKAAIFGGVILIAIGVKILLDGILG